MAHISRRVFHKASNFNAIVVKYRNVINRSPRAIRNDEVIFNLQRNFQNTPPRRRNYNLTGILKNSSFSFVASLTQVQLQCQYIALAHVASRSCGTERERENTRAQNGISRFLFPGSAEWRTMETSSGASATRGARDSRGCAGTL